MTRVAIPLDPATPEEAAAARKDASWLQVARLATQPGVPSAEARRAIRAFRLYLDTIRVHAPRTAAPTEGETRAWFDAWYTMRNLDRALGVLDAAKKAGG